MKENISDQEILNMFRLDSKKNQAFELLVRKYQQKIYWQIRRIVEDHDDANDVMQEIFLKVWMSLDGFREDSQLYSWLFRITHNECITWHRKNSRTRNHDDVSTLSKADEESLPSDEQSVSSNEIEKKLYEAIETLPEKQKIIFHLKYFQELKYEEISTQLGTSVGALKASYHIAVKKIENYLSGN
ncbi:MAG: RNA polymerase sigma factor [bacterium]|jgi:RNA polymerase sigma-70 factor (family 1)